MPSAKGIVHDAPKLDVSRAAQAAMGYFRQLFPTRYDMSLEEVELSEDGKFWLITLGSELRRDPRKVDHIFNPPKAKFKVFKVNARTGEVVSMKMRSIE